MSAKTLDVGDILVTRSGGWGARLIRLGAALLDETNLNDHVAVLHHKDAAGTWWAIEGRPGGVGYQDAAAYISSSYTTNNAGQLKTPSQREQIAQVVEGMLGTPYDWDGIVADAMTAVHVQAIWAQNWKGKGPPAQVVCSSLASWAYGQVGLDRPTFHGPRLTTPADWGMWITQNRYGRS